MAQVVEYPLDDGGALYVQASSVDDSSDGLGLASVADERSRKAAETLGSAMNHVTPALRTVVGQLRDVSPDELTIQFHLTLTAETGVVISKGGDDAHFTVTAAWSANRRSEASVPPPDGASR